MWEFNGKKKLTPEHEENFTFLGRSVDFKGVVNFDGTVRIDGRFEGEIHTRGTLIVGEHAVIKGIITAGTLVTGGKIHGNVTAIEKIQLLKPAILVGDVRTPSISIEDGAHFHGACDMGVDVDKWEEEDRRDLENVHDLSVHRDKVRAQDFQP